MIQPIKPIQPIRNIDKQLHYLDGTQVYNKHTGNTEGDITEMSFEEVLKIVREKE